MKKILKIALITIFALFSIYLVMDYTIIVPLSDLNITDNTMNKGDTISPFKNIDFAKGDFSVFLVLSNSDLSNISNNISKHRCLVTSDKSLLKKMQENWVFTFSGSDLSTVESSIYVFQNNKLLFKSGITLDETAEGLQSQNFGWIKPIKKHSLIDICSQFKKYKYPILFL